MNPTITELDAISALDGRFPEKHREKTFWDLPQRLQDKIYPPFVLDSDTRAYQYALLSPVARDRLKIMDEQHARDMEQSEKFRLSQKAKKAAEAAHAPRDSAGLSGHQPQATPLTNRGVKSQDGSQDLPSFEAKELLKVVPLGKGGKYQVIAIPQPDKSQDVKHSFIDWVNFTFKAADNPIDLNTGHPALSDDDYITALSADLYSIFGYGVTRKRESGMNFYQSSYDLGFNGWGLVCIGGQQGSVLVTVKGQGLMSAKVGWEMRLYKFLKNIKDAKITRVDLAHDDYNSDVSVDDYLNLYRAGLFNGRGCPPEVECHGNWEKPNGKGRTLYVGSRKSGRYLRIYEKGLQLANGYHLKFPRWVRVELELKNDCRIIPLDVLLCPGQYLAGAYPALAKMHQKQERIQTFRKTVESTFERSLAITREQFGKYIWAISEVLGADEALKRLTEGKEELPKNLIFDTHENFNQDDYLHTDVVKTITIEDINLWQVNPNKT